MDKLIYIDTETTSSDPKIAEVIELAHTEGAHAIPFVSRYLPDSPIEWGALAAHGILRSDLEGCPLHLKAKVDLPSHRYWIGHNVDYDWQVLGSPAHVRRIDTLAIARKLFPKLDSHKLGVMFLFLAGATRQNLEALRKAHSALFDCLLVERILHLMLESQDLAHYLNNPELLWQFSESCRIPDVMGFGKHKGLAIKDVPAGYVAWYRRQDDQDPYLLKAFAACGK